MIRKIEEKDIPVILKWYNWYIRNSTATFETEELTLDDLNNELLLSQKNIHGLF